MTSTADQEGGKVPEHPVGPDDRTTTTGTPRARRPSVLRMRRSRGAVSGIWLVVLGAWGALVPFIGPYFAYAFGPPTPWLFTVDRLILCVLPGLAVLLGGLILGPSGNRLTAGAGAWLALAGGIWFVVGPAVSVLWGGGGVAAPIGPPLGPPLLMMLEQLGYFSGLGALVITLAAGAMGRLTVRPAQDAEY